MAKTIFFLVRMVKNNPSKSLLLLNKKYSEIWPNITKKREEDVPKGHEKWSTVRDKLKYLSEKPGKGD